MSIDARPRVVFRMAAGPQMGFGHLVRCRSLARAMGVALVASVRGTRETARAAAGLGWTLVDAGDDARLKAAEPDLLVVDDPSSEAAATWVRRARRLGVPVATIHDLGRGHLESDLVVDGSIVGAGGDKRVRLKPDTTLRGPSFAILDPSILQAREAQVSPVPGCVLIALGGGTHVYPVAARLSKAIAARMPGSDIRVARGFAMPRHAASLPHASWVEAPNGLADEMSRATVAVVAGGVTLYEACALGVPAVAMAVTPAQHVTIRGFVCRGAAVDGGRPPLDDAAIDRAAEATVVLLRHDTARLRHAREARHLVDARGAFRVAERLRQLISDGSAAAGPRRIGVAPHAA